MKIGAQLVLLKYPSKKLRACVDLMSNEKGSRSNSGCSSSSNNARARV